LIGYPYLDHTQLFNLTSDPHEMRADGVKRPLATDRRIPAEVDWSKVTQRMDAHQPEWIRQRYSSPGK
jgi:hypothetical protein